MTDLERTIREYRVRRKNYQILIDSQKEKVRENRKDGVEPYKSLDLAELRRLNDLEILCGQILADLDNLRADD